MIVTGVTAAQINKKINDASIKTWSVDGVGDYSHTTPSQTFRGFLQPKAGTQGLEFDLVITKGSAALTQAESAALIGRFTETLLSHFAGITVTIA